MPNCDHQITGNSNDLVARTARYPERARVVDPRRERGKGRQPPSKETPRELNRAMVARKATESGESGSISKAEGSNFGEIKKLSSSLLQKSLRGATTARQISRTEENKASASPRPIEDPPSLGSPRSSTARVSETRARENTRWSPASATLEQSGRKRKHEGREVKQRRQES